MQEKSHLKYKICISGAAETNHCSPDAFAKAEELGREIVRQGAIVVTGATTGVPYWSAKGAKEEGGISIGLSPASSEKEHINKYHLPIDYFDLIIYTGFEYAGRNLLLTRSSDAIIFVCGRMGTLNEFTISFEEKKIMGVLEETGGTADFIRELIPEMHRGSGGVIYEKDPKILVSKIIKKVEETKRAS